MLSPAAWIALVALAQIPAATSPKPRPSVALRAEQAAVRARETKALASLAAQRGGDAARAIEALIDPPDAADGSSRFIPLAEVIPRASPPSDPDVKAIRLDAAKAYFEVATKALKLEPPRLAVASDCLHAAVEHDPNHAGAFRLLGYLPHEGGWATPFAVAKLKAGSVLHPTFGWVDRTWVEHLDKGELPAPQSGRGPVRWLPIAEADALRADFAAGWRINTEHFSIQTNVPLNEAISFGRKLEALYDLFAAMMGDVVGRSAPMAQLARDPKLSPAAIKAKVHRVYFFAEKSQYVDYLLAAQGEGVRTSLGTYLQPKEMKGWADGVGTSFFFRDPGGQLDVVDTLYHEASHQLLFETAGPDKFDPQKPNFWVVEGLGTYFETLRTDPDGVMHIGGMVGPRMASAQFRIVKDREFVPIDRLVTYNVNIYRGDNGGDIYLNYAESMAIAVFLMQSDGARLREPFLEYVADVFRGRGAGSDKKLADRLGVDYARLNREFLAYLKSRRVVP